VRRAERALYERLITLKDEQIADLRAQLGFRTLAGPVPGLVPDHQPTVLGSATWESDADEAQAIIEKNGLSKVHLAEILDGLGVGSSDLS
jgi:hypothetical protein